MTRRARVLGDRENRSIESRRGMGRGQGLGRGRDLRREIGKGIIGRGRNHHSRAGSTGGRCRIARILRRGIQGHLPKSMVAAQGPTNLTIKKEINLRK